MTTGNLPAALDASLAANGLPPLVLYNRGFQAGRTEGRMFRVTTSITGGHEPGEVKPAEAFTGCDIPFLVGNGALVPVDGPAKLAAAPTDPAGLMDEVERLTGEVDGLRSENAHLRDQLAAAVDGRPVHPDVLVRAVAAPDGGQLAPLREELAAVRSQLALTAEERDSAVADVERLRAECGRLAEELHAVRAELTAVRDVTADDPQPKRKK